MGNSQLDHVYGRMGHIHIARVRVRVWKVYSHYVKTILNIMLFLLFTFRSSFWPPRPTTTISMHMGWTMWFLRILRIKLFKKVRRTRPKSHSTAFILLLFYFFPSLCLFMTQMGFYLASFSVFHRCVYLIHFSHKDESEARTSRCCRRRITKLSCVATLHTLGWVHFLNIIIKLCRKRTVSNWLNYENCIENA